MAETNTVASPLSDIDRQIAELTQQRIRSMTPASPMPMPSTPGLPAAPAAAGTPTATPAPSQPAPYDLNSPHQPMPAPELPPIEGKPQFDWQAGSAQRNVRPDFGGGATGAIGTAAYMGDAVLRGYMQGKQFAEQKRTAEIDRLQKGLRYNYEVSARNYLGMIESGSDPSSPEVQQARDARDAAWNTLMQMQSHYIMGDEGGKKKPKKKAGSTPAATGAAAAVSPDADPASAQNIAAMLQSADPQEKAKGVFLMSQKVGPPDEYQAKQIIARRQALANDPQYQIDQEVGQQLRIYRNPNATEQEREGALKKIHDLRTANEGRSTQERTTFNTPTASLPEGTLDVFGQPLDRSPGKIARWATVGNQTGWVPATRPTPTNATALKITKGGIQWGDKTISVDAQGKVSPWAVDSSGQRVELPTDLLQTAQSMWGTHTAEVFKGKTTATTTDEFGNVLQRSQVTPGVVSGTGAGSTLPSRTTHPPTPAPHAAAGAATPTPPRRTRFQVEREDRLDVEDRQEAAENHRSLLKARDKAKDDAKGAADRLTTMRQNLADIQKNEDNQQAKLSIVANHIGMTLGTQKGARITRAVWEEAINSAPWVEKEAAKWFHQDANGDYIFDGYKSGVTLTLGQAVQMVELAKQKDENLQQGYAKADKELKDFEAERTAVREGKKAEIEGRPSATVTPSPSAPPATPPNPWRTKSKSEPKSDSKPDARVKVRDKKTGKTGTLPQSQVDAAIASGQYERMQ